MLKIEAVSVLLIALAVSSCGGGGSGGNGAGNREPDESTQTGVFIDSVVSGLAYRTATLEGTTDTNGEFRYAPGESVIFTIGDVELPAVAGADIVTPRDVFATDDFEDRRVVNLSRLLLSLDVDGDFGNGISIAEVAHSAATGLSIDFDVPTTEFETNSDLVNLVAAGGGATGTLVDAEEAVAHLQLASLEGAWQLFGTIDWITAVFMSDGRYLISGTLPQEEDPTDGSEGLEFGSFEWDPVTGVVQVEVDTETDGDFGLSAFQHVSTVKRDSNSLILVDPDKGPDDIILERIESGTDNLIGAWLLDSSGSEPLVLIVFTATHYCWAEIGPATAGGMTGPEFGTYTWDSATGALNATPVHDHNGDWAFSGETSGATATVDGATLTLAFPGSEGVTLTRAR